MYIAVCDDQARELDAAEALLRTWQEQRQQTLRYKTFRNAGELLDAAHKERFTLYLLDVMMPGVNGISAAREIRDFDHASDIVFLTSSPGFAYESYSVQALDYLLKPIQSEKLFSLLDKIDAREKKTQESLSLKCGSVYIRIPFSQLSYVEVNGKHLYFNMNDGSVREVYGALNEYEALLLARPEFMHIHRSYIVNILQAAELSPAGLRTFSGQNLPVSRRLYPEIQKKYVSLFFSERA